jgi:hypothetical protein
MSNEIEVGGVVYRYTANIKDDSKNGMTQRIEVSNDEGFIGSKADGATYGGRQNQHPASSMKGVAMLIAHEIVGEFIRRTSK